MIKRIVVMDKHFATRPKESWPTSPWKEYHGMEEFITAHIYFSPTIEGLGNPLTPAEGRMLEGEIDRLRNLAVGEEMPLGEPEAGMTVQRITDAPSTEWPAAIGSCPQCGRIVNILGGGWGSEICMST